MIHPKDSIEAAMPLPLNDETNPLTYISPSRPSQVGPDFDLEFPADYQSTRQST